jgi:hypothetical protein
VASSVFVDVTLAADLDIDRTTSAPAAVVAVVAATGQPTDHGFSRRGDRPWRARFQIRGRDRIATAQALERRFRELGYEADAIFTG